MKKILLVVLLFQSMAVFSQDKKSKKKDAAKTENEAKKDSAASKGNTAAYNDFIKDAVTKNGLFKIHTIKDKIYFEIPNEVLGKDLLIVNKISRSDKQCGYQQGNELRKQTYPFLQG